MAISQAHSSAAGSSASVKRRRNEGEGGGFAGGAQECGHGERRAFVGVGCPLVEGHGGDFEGQARDDQYEPDN